MSCCPIEIGEFEKSEAVPCHAAHQSEKAGKAVRPLTVESDEAQQNVEQHGRPKLPADGMLGMPEEVADFEGLLDLFEESLDSPAATVEIADAGSSPLEVVREEGHDDPFAVHLDPCFDTPQALRILAAGLGSVEGNLVVADNVAFGLGLAQALTADMTAQVVLGTGDPEDTSAGEIEEVGEMDIGFIEDGDLPGLKSGTERHGADVVVMGGLLDDGEARKESLQVQPQMHLGGGLAATVLGPVHTVGNQSNGRGIDSMDRPLESTGQAAVSARRTEPRTKRLKMFQNAPKQFLHHVAVAVLVGMRKGITTWRDSTTNRPQFGSVVAKAVAHVIQSNRMSQLCEQKTDHVAPWRKGPGPLVHSMLSGKFFRQMRRDEFTKLMQCAAVMFGRRYCFHTSDSLVGIRRRPYFLSAFNQPYEPHPVG